MATTFVDYTGDGNATKTFSFPSIQQSDIKVDVDGDIKSSGTHYNIQNYTTTGGGTVEFTSGNIPQSPSAIRIFRDTDVDSAKATYTAGSSVKAADLNANHEQLLFAAQEEQNQTVLTSDIKDGAVTTAKIADLNVTTAKVANRSITKDKIAVNTITADEIDDNAVGGGELKDGAVDTQHVQTDAITKVKIGEARLKTLADMQSETASKLAASTALTADIADLNQIDGMQKATSITNDDTKFPTSGAVIDYVTAQIDALDAFKILPNEVSFPNTQFDSGVVISIGDAGGIVIDGSGQSNSSATTINGTAVKIHNFPTSLHGETLTSGVGLLVSSTGSSQIYNYHKLLATENDVKQLSDDINDFNSRYRTGTSTPTTNNDAGDLFYNTTSQVFQVYNGTDWEEVKNTGNFFISTLSPAFNGSVQDFTITNAPTYAAQILLSINGVIQKPNTGTSTPSEGFALSGNTIKLAAAPAAGSTYHAVIMGEAVNIGSPSDNTVTTASLQTSAVTSDKIASNAVTPAKISILTDSENKLRLNSTDNSSTWQRENKHMHQIRDDVYVESTINVGDKAGFDFTPLAISAFSYSGTTLTLTTATHAIAVGDNILIKDSASGFQEAFNTISGTTGTTVKVTRSSDPSASLSTANTKVIVYTPADPRGCINVAKDHDKFDQNTFNPILRGYVGKDLDTATGTNTEAFKIEIKKDSSATDHVATLLHSTREFGSGQRLALTIDDGDSYPDGKNLVLTQNGVKITADDSAFTDSDELLEVEGNAKIDGNLEVTGTLSAGGDGTISGDELFLTDSIKHVGDTDTSISFPSNDTIRFNTSGSTRLDLTSDGNVQIPNDTGKLQIGASQDLELYHDGTNSVIKSSTGQLSLRGNDIRLLNNGASKALLKAFDSGAVELYYDAVKKFETTANGTQLSGTIHTVTGDFYPSNDNTDRLGLSNRAWEQINGYELFVREFSKHLDSVEARFGNDDDFKIYHDGTSNYIQSSSQYFYIAGQEIVLTNAAANEVTLKTIQNGAVELYYDNSKKLETTSTGIDVNGSVTADDIITAGALLHEGDTDTLVHFSAADTIDLKTSGTERLRINNSGVSLFGVLFTNGRNISLGDSGSATDDRITFGESQDLQLYHDGSNSFLDNVTGGLYIRNNATNGQILIRANSDTFISNYAANEHRAAFKNNGAVELYYDGGKKFETTSDGVDITGTLKVNGSTISTGGLGNIVEDTTPQLGGDLQSNGNDIHFADSDKAIFGTGSDLQIYHDGSGSYILDNGAGVLNVKTNGTQIILTKTPHEILAEFNVDGSNAFYYDNSKKIETTSTGATVTGNITVSSDHPKLLLTDSNADSDFSVHVNGGVWHVRDETNNTNRIEVQSDGTVDIAGNLDANGGLDVTGNITVSGTVDGRDIASDGSKLDGIASGATNVTNNNQLTNGAGYSTFSGSYNDLSNKPSLFSGSYNDLSNKPTIPTNNNQLSNGAGYITSANGGNAATLDSIDSSQFLRSDQNDVATGAIEFQNGLYVGGGGSANYLDDYEEGTWTPTLRGGSNNASGYSIQSGSYTKVGRKVTVSFAVAITGKGSMSGDLHLVSLPFGVASNITGSSIEASGIAGYWKNVDPNLSHITCVADDADAIYFRGTAGAEDDPDQLTHSDIDSDFTVRGTVTYFV